MSASTKPKRKKQKTLWSLVDELVRTNDADVLDELLSLPASGLWDPKALRSRRDESPASVFGLLVGIATGFAMMMTSKNFTSERLRYLYSKINVFCDDFVKEDKKRVLAGMSEPERRVFEVLERAGREKGKKK
jgi:hypothetical protein